MEEGIYKIVVDEDLVAFFGENYKPTHFILAKCGEDKVIRFTYVEELERTNTFILYDIPNPNMYEIYLNNIDSLEYSQFKISDKLGAIKVSSLDSLTKESFENLKKAISINV